MYWQNLVQLYGRNCKEQSRLTYFCVQNGPPQILIKNLYFLVCLKQVRRR